MATLNQFQKYSQNENLITNNVLLMFSNLYEINPKYYEEFIGGITEDSEKFQAIPIFSQQVHNRGNGFIDGHIKMKASKIIIETKVQGLEWIDKLLKYTDSFDKNEYRLLIHLSMNKYQTKQIDEIEARLKEKHLVDKVYFHSVTYEDLVAQLENLVSSYPFEIYLQRLNEHFLEYCTSSNLMPSSRHVLRAMACGQSIDLNKKHKFYFDLASRGYSPFNYLGIYKWKAVRYVAKVENMIEANYEVGGTLDVINSTYPVTEDQKKRLKAGIDDSVEKGWDLEYGHRFFLLKDFQETFFEKTSPGGIFRVRYFNLETIFNEVPNNFEDMALQLKNYTWE